MMLGHGLCTFIIRARCCDAERSLQRISFSDNGEFTDVDQWWTWRDDVFHQGQALLLLSPAARYKRPGGTNSMTLPWGDRQGTTTLGLSFRRVRVKSSFASLLSKELLHADFTEFGESRWARDCPARCSAACIAQLLVFWLGIIRVDGLAFWHSFARSPDESTSQYTSWSYVLQSQWCERMWGLQRVACPPGSYFLRSPNAILVNF